MVPSASKSKLEGKFNIRRTEANLHAFCYKNNDTIHVEKRGLFHDKASRSKEKNHQQRPKAPSGLTSPSIKFILRIWRSNHVYPIQVFDMPFGTQSRVLKKNPLFLYCTHKVNKRWEVIPVSVHCVHSKELEILSRKSVRSNNANECTRLTSGSAYLHLVTSWGDFDS